MLTSLPYSIVIARDGNWSPSNGDVYAVFLACVICHGILASTLSKVMGKLQMAFVIMNAILILATIIALPIGTHNNRNNPDSTSHLNSAHYIFAQTENLTTWPTGWAFMLSWLSPIWTIGMSQSYLNTVTRHQGRVPDRTFMLTTMIGGFDSCVHMSEEAANATIAVPYGIIMSIGSCWIFGWIILIVIAACMEQNLENITESEFGQPMAQIYYDALGKSGALGRYISLLYGQVLTVCRFYGNPLYCPIHDGFVNPHRRLPPDLGLLP